MDLEEFLKDREYEKGEENLERALFIAKREWDNVRTSLRNAGDIGGFDKSDFMIGIIEEDVIIRRPLESPTKSVSGYSPTYYPMYFVKNLIRMDEKLSEKGYKTPEALYVYIELATRAAEKLGLEGSFSMAFGAGYASVRTGWIAEKGYPVERKIFADVFFYGRKKDYAWDPAWTSVNEKLAELFDKFMSWQKDEKLFRKEVKSPAVVVPMLV